MSALANGFAALLDGETTFDETKAFLQHSIGLMGDPDALATGAQALRDRMMRVAAPAGAIDVCGTGGDGAHTLNISTAVAFVLAGAGVTVAKHGNRAMSSKSGAADVLEHLGVKLTGHVPTLERCLREARIAFLFAQNHHPAMRHVAAARRELGVRTIFNLLGPLANPAGVKRQLVGVFSPAFLTPVAEALNTLGAERAWVVHGAGGLDELSGAGENHVAMLHDGAIATRTLTASHAHLDEASNEGLRGGPAENNARALRTLLEGKAQGTPYSLVVQLNAAAALVAAGEEKTLPEAALRAHDALTRGAALGALNTLIDITRSAP